MLFKKKIKTLYLYFLWLSYCKSTNGNRPKTIKEYAARRRLSLSHVEYYNVRLFFLFPKVSMVDFQLARYGSPALDLVSLLYCCTSAELRKQHMSELLEEYCASIVGFLTQTGCLHRYPDIRDRSVKSFF